MLLKTRKENYDSMKEFVILINNTFLVLRTFYILQTNITKLTNKNTTSRMYDQLVFHPQSLVLLEKPIVSAAKATYRSMGAYQCP